MSNTPKLRFPEFSGEWEEKKLSDFMTRITRKNSNNESSRVLTISSVDGLIDQGEFFKKQIASKDTSGYYLLKKGDFAYNKSYSVGYDYGSIKRLNRYENGVVSTLYICMSLTSDTNSDYLTHYFDSMKWNKSVSEISAEGARNHGLLNIPTDSFFQTKHFLAPSLAEQQKIAAFLSNVDSIITAETKILNALQKKKKALMQKLFTQQLRFKSDNGSDFPEWEEKKLISEFPFIRNGFVGTVTDFFTTEIDGIKYIEGTNIHDGYISNSINLFVTKEFHNAHKNSQLKENDILMVQSGHVGETAVVPKKLENSNCHALIIMSNGGNCSSAYVNYYFQSKNGKKQLSFLTTGSTIKHILASDMQNFVCPFPCIEEQQKIADCLSSMDSLIQTQQKIVTTWQQRKKALLQKMFI